MEKIQLHTREQEIIFDEIKKNEFLKSHFYFTGGTALSSLYLHHRYSDDLDFFNANQFDNQILFTLMNDWSKKHSFTFTSNFVEVVYIFLLTFSNKSELKVDFSYYPYKRLEKESLVNDIAVDSLLDIAVNKLLTISQRTEVKDFVDLYYLLDIFTIWDLRNGVKSKFSIDLDPLIIGADFLKVESFNYLPRMIKPLKLEELQSFFQKKAEDIGMKAIT
ncbi:MAG TPA: nucleotidyl transferase AbiEii/AbiGii toxin family protein [Candidatus Saccharimonadales bacterium]|nr:nucleotidyl transferase AbiEii/AbiGii toxin family protein [Candidatus Saccharimonadales bacterium]